MSKTQYNVLNGKPAKVKFKGEWYSCIGIKSNENGHDYFKLLVPNKKLCYMLVDTYDPRVTEIEYKKNFSNYNYNRIKHLNEEKKAEIVRMYQQGNYYISEICQMYLITPFTFRKVINEYQQRQQTDNL